MAEDSDLERTEPASSRRIEQAREKGQVVRSRELSTFVVLMAAVGGLMVMWSHLMDQMSALMRNGLSLDRAAAFDPVLMLSRFHQESLDILIAFFPFMLLMLVASLIAPIALGGWLFTLQALQPDFSKLSLLKGFGRMFSWNSVVELGKAVAKTVLIGGVAIMVVWHDKETMFALANESLDSGLAHLGHLIFVTCLWTVGSIALIVAVDVPFQLWEYSRKLKMTKEEVRQEAKETEGDPQIKARIRSMQREMARRRMMAAVPKADVIVTNPTHYAVALQYQTDNMSAPQVVAKGSALIALRIGEIGRENHIPVLQAPPLARALYRHTEIGDEIPAALYTAVAEVLAYVYQLKTYQSQGGKQPDVPENLPVPPELDFEAAE